jgi:hypothetical protein
MKRSARANANPSHDLVWGTHHGLTAAGRAQKPRRQLPSTQFDLKRIAQREPGTAGEAAGTGADEPAGAAGDPTPAWVTSCPSKSGNHCCRTNANSGHSFWLMGSDGGKPNFSKFLYCPRCKMRKSRCGPVESPVLPTKPIVLPISTRSPWCTNMRDKCRYIVSYPSECAIWIMFPSPPLRPANSTRPLPMVCTGVPTGAPKSVPICGRNNFRIG